MKEKLINNLSLKILSIFLAFLIWLSVVNVSNPEVTRTKEVSLEIENEQVLTSARKTYDLTGKSTVTVSYDVRKRDESRIRAADFRAYIDLAELYDVTGSVPVKVEVISNKEILSNVFAKNGTIRVKTEDLQRKRFDLILVTTNKVEDGYQVDAINLNPLYIYVDGPTSLVGQINYAGIPLDLSNRNSETADNIGTAMPVFYDANNTELDFGERVTTNVAGTGVNYEIIIHLEKTISLDFRVSGNVADGYRFAGLESDINTIMVKGMAETLAAINKITIPESVLSIEGATGDRQVTVGLQQYLPEGVSIISSTDTAEVVLKVEKLVTRKFMLDRRSIIMQGANSDYQYVMVPERIELTVQGLKQDLDALQLEDIGATLDVSSFEPGNIYPGNLTYSQNDVFGVVSVTSFHVITALDGEDVDTETTEAPETSVSDSGETSAGEAAGSQEETADFNTADIGSSEQEETNDNGS